MSVCLLLIDDLREDYLARCLESIGQFVGHDFAANVTILDPDHELGFAGSVQEGWRQVLETGCEWVFHVEGDFVFNEPVEIERMIAVLRRHPHLTQMSLLRQPWNEAEKAAGGIVQQWPEDFHEVSESGDVWTETRRWVFTTNPSVYSVEVCKRGFPDPPEAEGRFGGEWLKEEPWRKSAFWGPKFGAPKVTHIGEHRTGTGY